MNGSEKLRMKTTEHCFWNAFVALAYQKNYSAKSITFFVLKVATNFLTGSTKT
jgi:hypothetical protein